jgi:pyruvate dehydrogenase E1 component beta subunit
MLITYREAIRHALRELLADPAVFLMGEDIGAYGGAFAVTKGMHDEFGPERVRDTPISESVIIGAGIGACLAGARPIVEIMTINFTLVAFDMIVNHAAKIHAMSGGGVAVPLIMRTVTGSGRQLGAQHSQNIEGHYAMVPGLKVLAPATPADARGLLLAAYDDRNPVFIAEHFDLYSLKGEVPEAPTRVPIGPAAVWRAGTDVTLISYSHMSHRCRQAADTLATHGIDAEVIDLRTLRPLDLDTLEHSVRKTGQAIVVEEAGRGTSIGGIVIAELQARVFEALRQPIGWLAGLPVPMPYNRHLEQIAIPAVEEIVEAATRLCAGRGRKAA